MRVTALFLAIIAIMSFFATPVNADDLKIANPFAYGTLTVPTKNGEEFSLSTFRFGGDFYRTDDGPMVTVEFDATPGKVPFLRFGYFRAMIWERIIANTDVGVDVGQFLNPAQLAYPGVRDNELTRWPDAEAGLGVLQRGVRLTSITRVTSEDELTTCASSSADGRPSFWIRYASKRSGHAFSANAYGEARVGYGVNLSDSGEGMWWSPTFGGTHYTDGRNVGYAQMEFSGIPGIHIWAQYDRTLMGVGSSQDSYLVGVTVPYSTQSFLKAYYDDATNRPVIALTAVF